MTLQERLAAAAQAEKEGRARDAIAAYAAAAAEERAAGRALPAAAAVRLGLLLHNTGRSAEAEQVVREALGHAPKSVELNHLLGAVLRRLGRPQEALEALDTAQRLDPRNARILASKGFIWIELGEGRKALDIFAKLAKLEPRNGDFQRQMGLAHLLLQELDKAETKLRYATRLAPRDPNAWLDYANLLRRQGRDDEALAALATAAEQIPGNSHLVDARLFLLQQLGREAEVEATIAEALARDDRQAWAHARLGAMIVYRDRERAVACFRRAVELEPQNQTRRMLLAGSLNQLRTGDEGANIEAALTELEAALALGPLTQSSHITDARSILLRTGRYDALPQLGSFSALGRAWARSGAPHPLADLGQVRTPEDRLELLDYHRLWGRRIGEAARRNPIARPAVARGAKLRLGILSSDLRDHPVGRFFRPLVDHPDRGRFEVHCYSFNRGRPDEWQDYFAAAADSFRLWPQIGAREAAEAIAGDGLDMLIELGGTTAMNKLEVMSYRPAPIQASWLAYPHSAGLETIDYLVADPYVKPATPELLIERPLELPHSWIAFDPAALVDEEPIEPRLPEERSGRITFGSANNPYKFSPAMLQTWARVVGAVDGAEFLLVRPECGAAPFRDSIAAAFAAEGVGRDRLRFEAVRGKHLPYYNRIDISLDTFPQTGGTTTCEVLCMGVPVVTLVGPTFFERLSYSILTNAGLADLCCDTLEDYVRIAVALAADRPRRSHLRQAMRAEIAARPLGQPARFAADFYDLVARTVLEQRG